MEPNDKILQELRLLREEVSELKKLIPKKKIPIVHPMDAARWSLYGKKEGVDFTVGVGIP